MMYTVVDLVREPGTMDDFLETLKSNMQDAQKKLMSAQQKLGVIQNEFHSSQQRFNAAQVEFQTALQEFNAYQTLVATETRKLSPNQPPSPAVTVVPSRAHVIVNNNTHRLPGTLPPAPPNVQTLTVAVQPVIDDNKSDGNKTEAVRMLLRQHPTGMTPGEMWKSLESQLSSRVYLYSVLKRLKDRGDVRTKRGKYYFTVKMTENENHTVQ
jgi:hypothetical protein